MYVCICKAITTKQIEEATAHNASIQDICKKLGVGSECGACLTDFISNQKSNSDQVPQKDSK